jgi:hypothetical protein
MFSLLLRSSRADTNMMTGFYTPRARTAVSFCSDFFLRAYAGGSLLGLFATPVKVEYLPFLHHASEGRRSKQPFQERYGSGDSNRPIKLG